MIIDDEQLHQRGMALSVDHDSNFRTGVVDISKNLIQQCINDLICCLQLFLLHARLSMDTDTDLHLIVSQLKSRLSGCRNRTWTDSHTHGSHVINNLLSNSLYFVNACTCLSQSTCDLMYEYGTCNATTSCGI